MLYLSKSLQQAVDEFSKLPGIGKQSAQRIVFYLLKIPSDEVGELAKAIVDVTERAIYCSTCYNIAESDPCALCSNSTRDHLGLVQIVTETCFSSE